MCINVILVVEFKKLWSIIDIHCIFCSAAGRWKLLEGPVVIGGDNLLYLWSNYKLTLRFIGFGLGFWTIFFLRFFSRKANNDRKNSLNTKFTKTICHDSVSVSKPQCVFGTSFSSHSNVEAKQNHRFPEIYRQRFF